MNTQDPMPTAPSIDDLQQMADDEQALEVARALAETAVDELLEGDDDITEETVDLALEIKAQPVSPEVEAQAVRYLRAYRNHKLDSEALQAAYKAEIARLSEIAKAEEEKAARRLQWLSGALQGYYAVSGAKRITLPYGALSLRKQAFQVRIEDEADFVAHHGQTSPYVRTKLSPDRVAIRAAIKEDGDIPTGVEVETPEAKFTITLTKE